MALNVKHRQTISPRQGGVAPVGQMLPAIFGCLAVQLPIIAVRVYKTISGSTM